MSSCAYKLSTNSETLPGNVRRIQIPLFKNSTIALFLFGFLQLISNLGFWLVEKILCQKWESSRRNSVSTRAEVSAWLIIVLVIIVLVSVPAALAATVLMSMSAAAATTATAMTLSFTAATATVFSKFAAWLLLWLLSLLLWCRR